MKNGLICLILNNLPYQPIIVGYQKIRLRAHCANDIKKYYLEEE
jgi:hypothetical protein